MMNKTFYRSETVNATQIGEESFKLEYYIHAKDCIVPSGKIGMISYGIEIQKIENAGSENQKIESVTVYDICCSEVHITSLLNILSRNQVTPVCAVDIIADLTETGFFEAPIAQVKTA